jgi:hypothetical protein
MSSPPVVIIAWKSQSMLKVAKIEWTPSCGLISLFVKLNDLEINFG